MENLRKLWPVYLAIVIVILLCTWGANTLVEKAKQHVTETVIDFVKNEACSLLQDTGKNFLNTTEEYKKWSVYVLFYNELIKYSKDTDLGPLCSSSLVLKEVDPTEDIDFFDPVEILYKKFPRLNNVYTFDEFVNDVITLNTEVQSDTTRLPIPFKEVGKYLKGKLKDE